MDGDPIPSHPTCGSEGSYRLDPERPIPRGWSITAADMATALLDIAERDDLGRKHVYVAN